MNVSGEWVSALALNAVRHRMGSRHAIETVLARWVQQHTVGNAVRGKREIPISVAISPTISPSAAFKAAASVAM